MYLLIVTLKFKVPKVKSTIILPSRKVYKNIADQNWVSDYIEI